MGLSGSGQRADSDGQHEGCVPASETVSLRACARARHGNGQAWERGKSGEVLVAHIEESVVEFSHEWKMDCRLPAEADL